MVDATWWELSLKKSFKRGRKSFEKTKQNKTNHNRDSMPEKSILNILFVQMPGERNSAEYVWKNYYSASETLSDGLFSQFEIQ